MPQEAKLSVNERTFILQALREGIRLDGRSLDAYRDIQLSFGQEHGAVDVKLGKTRSVSPSSSAIELTSSQGACEDIMRGCCAVS